MWRHFLIYYSIDIKKNSFARWCSGVVVAHVLWLMVWFHGKILFLVLWKVWTHTAYEFIFDEFSMNSCIFCTLNIWIHMNMNSYYVWIPILFAVIMYEFVHFLQYEFILCMNSYTFCSYHVWIHIFFAVQNKIASAREPRARSASREGKARAHLLPRPGRTRLPRPLGLRAAAPIVRVACGCPDS